MVFCKFSECGCMGAWGLWIMSLRLCPPTLQVIRVKNTKGTRLPATAVTYSPKAAHIVVGGEVRESCPRAHPVRTLCMIANGAVSVCSPPALRFLCLQDGSIHFWNVRKGQYPPRPDGCVRSAHEGQVTCVVFNPVDDRVFASRSLDNTIKVGQVGGWYGAARCARFGARWLAWARDNDCVPPCVCAYVYVCEPLLLFWHDGHPACPLTHALPLPLLGGCPALSPVCALGGPRCGTCPSLWRRWQYCGMWRPWRSPPTAVSVPTANFWCVAGVCCSPLVLPCVPRTLAHCVCGGRRRGRGSMGALPPCPHHHNHNHCQQQVHHPPSPMPPESRVQGQRV
jgi:hypothetical protein